MNNWQVCPTCGCECKYKDGILCKSYVCAKKDEESGKTPKDGGLASLLNIFGIKPGDPTYNQFVKK